MGKYLVIITENMYSGGWLIDEIPYHLSRGYDDIFCFNTQKNLTINTPIVDHVKCKCLTYKKRELLLYMFLSIFSPMLIWEILNIHGKNKIKKGFKALCVFSFALLYKSKIRKELSREGIDGKDAVIFYAYWMSVQALSILLLKKFYNRSICVSRCHGIDLYSERRELEYIEFQMQLVKQLDYIFPISENGAERIMQLLKQRGMYNESVKNKVILSRLGCMEIEGITRGRTEEVFRVLTCSNVIPVKRLHLVIDVLNEVDAMQIEWNHYGDGEQTSKLLDEAKRLKDNVLFCFHGRVEHDEIIERLKTGKDDLLINVSYSEGIPVSIMEAYASGLPVIATNVGGVDEILQESQKEYLIPRDFDNKKVAKIIEKIINMNEQDYSILSDSCRDIWREFYSAEKNYYNFSQFLCKLVE